MDTDLLTVGVGLAALMVGLFGWLKTDISRLDKRVDGLRGEMGGLRQEMRQANEGLRGEMQQANEGLRGEMRQSNDELRGEMGGLRQEMRQANEGLRREMAELREDVDKRLRLVEHGQAKLEGLLEGLREAIVGRNAA